MVLQRQDRKFVDISLSFLRNPVSNDVLLIKNEDAIKKSILNLVFTKNGERFFNPSIGSKIRDSLFELADPITELNIESTIKLALENYEPRIKVISVNSIFDNETNECKVEIIYNIIGTEVFPQNLNFILKSTKA